MHQSLGHDEIRWRRRGLEAGCSACTTLQRFARGAVVFYPPILLSEDVSMALNGATNASGARTFKYGPTRN